MTLIWCRNAAYMVNQISYDVNRGNSPLQKLTSDTVIEVMAILFNNIGTRKCVCIVQEQNIIVLFWEIQVNIEIPFAFRAIPVQAIESAGTQVLEQILKLMLPRFTAQVFWKKKIRIQY